MNSHIRCFLCGKKSRKLVPYKGVYLGMSCLAKVLSRFKLRLKVMEDFKTRVCDCGSTFLSGSKLCGDVCCICCPHLKSKLCPLEQQAIFNK